MGEGCGLTLGLWGAPEGPEQEQGGQTQLEAELLGGAQVGTK